MIRSAKSKIEKSCIMILMLVGVLVFASRYSDVFGYHDATYTESAHGDSTSGVNRQSMSIEQGHGYAKGNCAHCHEQHASVGGSSHTPYDFGLFAPNNPTAQDDDPLNFCFQCHKGVGYVQVGGITNNDYGATFGGGTANSTNIKAAFNYGPPNQPENGTSGSSHRLLAIHGWTKNKTIGDWITDDTNACVVCHDPHYAQKNYPVVTTGQGGVKTAIRRPHARSSGTNKPRNLFGDESGALTPELTSEDIIYQPPKRADSGYEPAGDKLPNFMRFCDHNSCHSVEIGDDAHDAYFAQGRNLFAILWTAGGDTHGLQNSNSAMDWGITKAPYGVEATNYKLSCTDCHEPHGSPNQWLLRTTVNGVNVGTFDEGHWMDFCLACHTFTEPVGSMHDGSQYPDPLPCNGCHYHGVGGWCDYF